MHTEDQRHAEWSRASFEEALHAVGTMFFCAVIRSSDYSRAARLRDWVHVARPILAGDPTAFGYAYGYAVQWDRPMRRLTLRVPANDAVALEAFEGTCTNTESRRHYPLIAALAFQRSGRTLVVTFPTRTG